ncbi:DUF2284 domain-containing protein [Alkalispirochaeta alkalica]|uniref:DUF2284 domain-containing protein n=1 Tax=Alkalispirochaeta alkalica TaxID=46356 RepID=UPI00035C7BC6|nr:DUF2284 domain-containing protein [Alkalispirochaeta alkalica]
MIPRDYLTSRSTRLVPAETLLAWYEPLRVEGYCRACPFYGSFWSCPPHPFSGEAFLRPFSWALVVAERITRDPRVHPRRPLEEIFQESRRELGQELLRFLSVQPPGEERSLEVLIAGNCYHCSRCSRDEGKPCRFPRKMKYSLESLGFLVSDMVQELLDLPLEWPSPGQEPAALVAVALILSHEAAPLERFAGPPEKKH